jgi:hypothetical protein
MSFEVVEYDGRRYAEIIWSGTSADNSVFFSPADSSFQFGLLAHHAGFVEPAHYHPQIERRIDDLQQMFVVQKGLIAVDFFSDSGDRFREVILRQGDAILLIHGAHSVRVLETMQCISVKQGPFLGADRDKVDITVKR